MFSALTDETERICLPVRAFRPAAGVFARDDPPVKHKTTATVESGSTRDGAKEATRQCIERICVDL